MKSGRVAHEGFGDESVGRPRATLSGKVTEGEQPPPDLNAVYFQPVQPAWPVSWRWILRYR
jgi:hypothetical protein